MPGVRKRINLTWISRVRFWDWWLPPQVIQTLGNQEMKQILTEYLYPLREEVPFLASYGLAFDNPRTTDELLQVEQLLRTAVPDGVSLWSILKSPIEDCSARDKFSIRATLLSILERLPRDDAYVRQFVLASLDEDPFTALARMWVWVRVAEKQVLDEFCKDAVHDRHDIYLPPDKPEHLLDARIHELALLASLIACQEPYWEHRSFLLKGYGQDQTFRLGSILFGYRLSCLPNAAQRGLKPSPWFHEEVDALLKASSGLDVLLKGPDRELVLYLSNLINASTNYALTEKARLLLLVSAIELMLTHNPDFNRFNIEDSISKQFLLKLGVVLYRSDESLDIQRLREDLRHIYNVRSKIAHGDYNGLRKIICKKLSRTDYNQHMEERHVAGLNEATYLYIRTLVNEYLRCPEFIKFLKDN